MENVLEFKDDTDERRRAWLKDRCNVPASYLHATRESWREDWHGKRSPWPAAVDDWTGEGDQSILTLIGKPGVGKTHVAVSLLTEFQRHPDRIPDLILGRHGGVPSKFIMVRVPQAVRSLRLHYELKDSRDAPPHIRGKSVPAFLAEVAEKFQLVIYDDWGSQNQRDNWWETVEGWVDDRHANQLPTILTMNSVKGSSERVARRIVDGLVVDMPWSSDR